MGTTLLKGEGTDNKGENFSPMEIRYQWGEGGEFWDIDSSKALKYLSMKQKNDGVLVLVQGKNEAGFNFISTKREKK